MATIKDKYTLDATQYISALTRAAKSAEKTAAAVKDAQKANASFAGSVKASNAAVREAERAQKSMARAVNTAEKQFAKAAKSAYKAGKAEADTVKHANAGLLSSVKSLAAGYVSLRGAMRLTEVADEYANIKARLSNMAVALSDVKAMQDALHASASRSRAPYADTAALVTQLGTLAPEAFGSFNELVMFSEQVNKNIVLSGASATAAQAAMLQLTQALGSGTLRGEELNSILEQTPMIARRIAKYMGMNVGEMRKVAAEGKITAQVVKNAMLSTVEETNKAFNSMPKTWGQVWTKIKDDALSATEPVLDAISKTAKYAEIAAPYVEGLALAFGVYEGATIAATAATYGLSAALDSIGIGLVLAGLGLIAGRLLQIRYETGSWEVVWLKVQNTVANGITWLDERIADCSYGLSWLFIHAIEGIINVATAGINQITRLINNIPGVDIAPLEKNTTLSDELAGKRNYYKRFTVSGHKFDKALREQTIQEKTDELKKAQLAVSAFDPNAYKSLLDPNAYKLPTGGGTVAGIARDTAAIRKSTEMTREDLSLIVDMATRRYVNNINLETQAPVIQISGQNTGNSEADARALADKLKWLLVEQMQSSGNVSYAFA